MTDHLEVDAESPPELLTLIGGGRLPSDLAAQLMDVLFDEPRIVVCDLTGISAPDPISLVKALRPVASYLNHWPGTVVAAYTPDASIRGHMADAALSERLLIHSSPKAAVTAAGAILTSLDHARVDLPPRDTAPALARSVVTEKLLSWHLSKVVATATLVVSELVSNALMHAPGVVSVALSRANDRVRIAVRDRSGGRGITLSGHPGFDRRGWGLDLVTEFALQCGVFPGRIVGKTVWAVLDSSSDALEPAGRSRRTDVKDGWL